ncbi:MAG: phage tail assembly chaperone [Hyphomonas sp.]|nr:phage tail assembly chaperone [Hyphomonas sp.]
MLPWGAMLRAALTAGLSPEAFWRLSLREWRWLAGAGGDGMGRGRLVGLMDAFPDEPLRMNEVRED